jgi:hypothetical protein
MQSSDSKNLEIFLDVRDSLRTLASLSWVTLQDPDPLLQAEVIRQVHAVASRLAKRVHKEIQKLVDEPDTPRHS